MSNAGEDRHVGRCFCGAVEVEVRGAPLAMGYCHCESCRAWSAAPVNAFVLWPPEAVTVTKGADRLGAFARSPQSNRRFCATCGGHVFSEHPTWGFVDVYAATLPSLPFAPTMHVSYAEAVLRVRDGLPKFRDFPAESGGSGALMDE